VTEFRDFVTAPLAPALQFKAFAHQGRDKIRLFVAILSIVLRQMCVPRCQISTLDNAQLIQSG
jgi:hypothetical protein